MTKEPRHKAYGRTVSEWISLTPGELVRDAVGMWQIVPEGRWGFGFEGPELVDFVHRSVQALVERGAKPVRGGRGTGYNWILQPQYGDTPAKIVDAVMAEWLAAGMPNCDFESLWFSLPGPDVYEAKGSVRL